MFVDPRILTGLIATLGGAGVIIVAQKNEINRLKAESRNKSVAIGVFRRGMELLIDDATIQKVRELIKTLDEESEFIDIIKHM